MDKTMLLDLESESESESNLGLNLTNIKNVHHNDRVLVCDAKNNNIIYNVIIQIFNASFDNDKNINGDLSNHRIWQLSKLDNDIKIIYSIRICDIISPYTERHTFLKIEKGIDDIGELFGDEFKNMLINV